MTDESLNVPVQGAALPQEMMCGLFADIVPPAFPAACVARIQRPNAIEAVKTYRLPVGSMIGMFPAVLAGNMRTTSTPQGMRLIADIIPPDFGDDGAEVLLQLPDLSIVGVPVPAAVGTILVEVIPEAAIHVRKWIEQQVKAQMRAMQKVGQNAVGRRG